ncbi:MAG: GAF domain-containing protein [Nostoc sp.]
MKAGHIDAEVARLEALSQYQILDTEPEEAYNNLAQLAAFICDTPISLVNFIDENRQWFKAKVGLDVSEMPRYVGLSYLCQEQRQVVVVPDTLADEKLAKNPIVTGYPYLRFYAGVPLITPKGDMLGTLCVIDQIPRELSEKQVEALVALSRLVIDQLELRLHVTKVSQITEKLMAQEQAAHAQSEAARIHIANLLESITDGFFALDKEWQFTYINSQAERLLQTTQNELLGKNIWEVFPEIIGTTFHRDYHRAILEQVSVEFEEFYPLLNCWLQVHAYPTKDGLCVYFQDITERRKTSVALRESEERWQLALHGNNDGIWDWNLKTNEVFFSTQWQEMLGYKDHEVSNCWDEWTKRIHADERDGVLQAFQDHFAKKTPFYICEYRVQCQDGSYKWILDRGQGLWDALGDIVRMVGSYTDITDRKRADEELKRQNLRSQLFAEITLKIRESLQIDEILKTTVTEVQKLLQVDRVLIFRLETDGSGTVVQEAVLPGWPVIIGENIFDPCFKEEYIERYCQGRVNALEDIETAHIQPCHREFLQQFAVRANLVVPILVRDGIWGLLLAHQCATPRQWNQFETDLLQQLAFKEVTTVVVELMPVERLDERLNYLKNEIFDVILLDLSLPDSQGLQTFVMAHNQAKATLIIVLTGINDETLATRAMQEGAQDYLVKGQVTGDLLVRSMRYAIERQRALRDRKLAEEKIREQAALLNVTTDAICVLDLNNQILFWNKGADNTLRLASYRGLGQKC